MKYLTKGESAILEYQVKNNSGGVVDLTSAEITFTLKEDATSDTAQVQRFNTAAGGGDTQVKVVSASLGLVVVYLSRANTLALTGDTMYYGELQVTDSSDNSHIIEERLTVRHGLNTSGTASISNILQANKYAKIKCTYEDTVSVEEQYKFSSTITASITDGVLTINSIAEFTQGETQILSTYDIYSWTWVSTSQITVDLADWESGRINTIRVIV